ELLRHPEVTRVTLADLHPDGVASFLSNFDDDQRLVLLGLDVTDHEAVRGVMADHDAVMSAIPYYFNGPMAKLAVEAGCHSADLRANHQHGMARQTADQ